MKQVYRHFNRFSQAILSGQSGVFFMDRRAGSEVDFYYGIGDYQLVDSAEADLYPVFELYDWLGIEKYSYYFPKHYDVGSELGDIIYDFQSEKTQTDFGFKIDPEYPDQWQAKVRFVQAQQRAGDAWVLNLAHDQVNGTVTDKTSIVCDLVAIFKKFMLLDLDCTAGLVITNEQIICSMSPELFIQTNQSKIITKPIKGTGTRDYLESSEKEFSELDMITDLMRNDLGQICSKVEVLNARELIAEKNFMSARSTIVGALLDGLKDKTYRELLPAGSISGAPKKRVVEIIESIEDFKRNFYTGTFGVRLSPQRQIYNILIRTIFVDLDTKKWVYPVGVGITAESDPPAEWQETLDKVQLLTDLSS